MNPGYAMLQMMVVIGLLVGLFVPVCAVMWLLFLLLWHDYKNRR